MALEIVDGRIVWPYYIIDTTTRTATASFYQETPRDNYFMLGGPIDYSTIDNEDTLYITFANNITVNGINYTVNAIENLFDTNDDYYYLNSEYLYEYKIYNGVEIKHIPYLNILIPSNINYISNYAFEIMIPGTELYMADGTARVTTLIFEDIETISNTPPLVGFIAGCPSEIITEMKRLYPPVECSVYIHSSDSTENSRNSITKLYNSVLEPTNYYALNITKLYFDSETEFLSFAPNVNSLSEEKKVYVAGEEVTTLFINFDKAYNLGVYDHDYGLNKNRSLTDIYIDSPETFVELTDGHHDTFTGIPNLRVHLEYDIPGGGDLHDAVMNNGGSSIFDDSVSIADCSFYNPLIGDTFIVDGITYLVETENTVSIQSVTNPDTPTDLVIPSNVVFNDLTYSVKKINSLAFHDITNYTAISCPSTITELEDRAFRDCTGLVSITLSNNITQLTDNCFSGCTSLTSINLPYIQSIGIRCFYNCTSLTAVGLSNQLNRIGEGAFYDCTALSGINIPASVLYIEEAAFMISQNDNRITINLTTDNITDMWNEDWAGNALVNIIAKDIPVYSNIECKGVIKMGFKNPYKRVISIGKDINISSANTGSIHAIGHNININGTNQNTCYLYGTNLNSNGSSQKVILIGAGSTANNAHAIGIGTNCTVANSGVAIGKSCSVGQNGIAIGKNAKTLDDGVRVGGDVDGSDNVTATHGVSLGHKAHSDYGSVSVGYSSQAGGTYAISILGRTYNQQDISIGYNSSTESDHSQAGTYKNHIAIGTGANAGGVEDSIAIGHNAKTNFSNSIAIGSYTVANGYMSCIISCKGIPDNIRTNAIPNSIMLDGKVKNYSGHPIAAVHAQAVPIEDLSDQGRTIYVYLTENSNTSQGGTDGYKLIFSSDNPIVGSRLYKIHSIASLAGGTICYATSDNYRRKWTTDEWHNIVYATDLPTGATCFDCIAMFDPFDYIIQV